MRALALIADRKLELTDRPPPPPPARGEVQIRVKAVGLNHLDLWGYRGMAFARRKLPIVVGVEAAGEIAAIGPDVAAFKPGDRFANGLSVCSVVLLPLDVGLHVGRRHQERTVCPSALSSRDQ